MEADRASSNQNDSATVSFSENPKLQEVSFRLELDGRQPISRTPVSPLGSPVGPSGGGMQKCLSFPRIVTERPTSWSLSPCQSRAYLDACYPQSFLGGSEKSVDPDRLSIAGHAGLLRSMSARTVELDVRPEPDQSINSSGSSSRYLSPACDRINPLAGRSTSCPSMAYTGLSSRANGLPARTSSDVRNLLFRSGDQEEDIDLAGEEIDDLPIEPNTVFPELPPDLMISGGGGGGGSGEQGDHNELSMKGLQIDDLKLAPQPAASTAAAASSSTKESQSTGKDSVKEEATSKKRTTGKKDSHDSSYVNIGDLPRSSASDAMKQHRLGIDSSNQNIDTNQKCLRWLNTLPAQRS